jgi:hypothetical protein
MNASPSNPTIGVTARSPLYRIAQRAVICASLALILANLLFAQSSSRTKKLTGPRALGLIEVSPSGKMTLLPVTIMIDGEFYDASAYKAAPVPFALYTDTVYEGLKTGVSQGLFTVTEAQRGLNTWRGQGKWQSAADIAAVAAKKKASAAAAEKAKTVRDNSDGPPVLRRAGAPEQPAPASAPVTTSDTSPDDPNAPPVLKRPATDQSPSATTGPTATPAASTPTPATSTPAVPAPATVTQAGTPSSGVPAPAPQTAPPATRDTNVPTLRRGKAAAMKEEARESAMTSDEPAIAGVSKTSPAGKTPTVTATASATSNGIQLIPAISDAAGPDPRPYAYNMKPEEESKFRNKVLALAAVEIRARAKELGLATATMAPAHAASHSSTAAASHSNKVAKLPEPDFDNVQMRVLDLSNNNEPVLVLTADARLPKAAKGPDTDMQYVVTLVAREDIYGDLHKVFSNVTDTQHLDVSPRMEFIDAVDADGDGRGELLFQQVSDSGKAFVLYRVIGDQLWALFQGKLG